mmetsp:Transcript_27752/g.36374  ORF Transcript_27752/g.36374 Transcript_27752/m.36374 type:complete len:582 (-) Transcript_27752:386-2131(-)
MLAYYTSTGNVEQVKQAIADGEDVNQKDSYQFTAAHHACMYDYVEVLKILNENGADFSLTNNNGNTPLLLAAEKGYFDCVKYLAEECKVDIEARNIWKATPAQMACVFGNFDILKYLVEERGARLDVVNKYGASPLHFSFAGGQTEIIRWLILRDLGQEFQNSTPEAINNYLSRRFVKAARNKVPLLAFENMKLIPISKFLEAGEYPIYAKCHESGWHVSGEVITDSTRILFISHRWETPHHPDPEQAQYNLVVEFLKTSGREYDYVWLDYACITQEKSSPLFAVHLANIPTALFVANECLVVPKIDEVNEVKASNLRDYLDRGWCQLEAIVAMFTGCTTFVCYKGGEDHLFFQNLVPYRGTHTAGFQLATQESLGSMKIGIKNKVRHLWENATEPTEALKKFTDAVIVCHHQYPDLFEKIITLSLDTSDIDFMGEQTDDIFLGPSIIQAYNNIGNFTNEDDRIIVVRLLMFSMSYCMYDLEKEGYLTTKPENDTLETMESVEVLESVKDGTISSKENDVQSKQEADEAPKSEAASGLTKGEVEQTSNAKITPENQTTERTPNSEVTIVGKNSKGCGCTVM